MLEELAIVGAYVFLIKEDETAFTLWWKFIFAIVVSILCVIAIVTGTLHIPGKGEFFTERADGEMFWLLVIFCLGLSALSFWQGGYGIYQKYLTKHKP
ncbi:hypothetical protein [Alteromonas sp. AMM-1]|uniref:hypothetical protein n=1 Tax=Alteromonas sp. AMM-1 TaxID=3394233 RepID=UPI0039A60353